MERITKREDGTLLIETIFTGPTRTQRQFADMCDINKIMESYNCGESITHLNRKVGRYGDFSNIPNYQSALETVQRAQEAFMALPAKTRNRFQNDPQELLNFCSDSNNYNEAIELGLISKPANPTNANSNANDKQAVTQSTTPAPASQN